ncbi:hypothetical protein X275_02725 [Marinitoga sp. 1197]|nr:hypothetical protein X275_02725 [Marinitoga sp. 1197]
MVITKETSYGSFFLYSKVIIFKKFLEGVY